jgi:probable F420-dependent oxidoreductase
VKVGITFFNIGSFVNGDYSRILEIAREADARGIDTLSAVDHIAMASKSYDPQRHDGSYPYAPMPSHPVDEPIFEAMTLLAAIGAATRRIRLAMSILVAPARPAVLLAKQAATIDVLTGGRLDMCLGTGWQPQEFTSVGVPFKGRFGVMDEQIEVMKLLWSTAPASYRGRHVSFTDLWSCPMPAARTIPIWLGIGATDLGAKRIARYADGWIPAMPYPDAIREGIDRIAFECRAIGRDPSSLGVRCSAVPVVAADGSVDFQATLDTIPAMIAAGATEISASTSRFIQTEAQLDAAIDCLLAMKA